MADDQRWRLLDIMKRVDPNGIPAQIIQLLDEENDFLQTIPFFPTNQQLVHQETVMTGLPEVGFGRINKGVKASIGKTAQMTFGTGFVNALDQIDINLIDVSGNAASHMSMESMSKMESMIQLLTSTYFTGTLANPDGFVGFGEYYSALSVDPNNAGFNIIDGGGTTDLQSIWLVCWGPTRVYGIHPMHIGKAGFNRQFQGEHNIQDDDGHTLVVEQTSYKWHAGLVVADWRSVVRIANLDIVALKAEAASATVSGTGSTLTNFIIQAIERIRGSGPKSANLYMSEEMMTILRTQIVNKNNVEYDFNNVAGKKIVMFDNIPVRKVDQLGLENQVV